MTTPGGKLRGTGAAAYFVLLGVVASAVIILFGAASVALFHFERDAATASRTDGATAEIPPPAVVERPPSIPDDQLHRLFRDFESEIRRMRRETPR